MKEKAKCTLSCELKNTAHYSPKQELYVRVMKKIITAIVSVRCKLIVAFRSNRKALAEKVEASKLTNAVLNIAVCILLNKVLKRQNQIVGKYLTCVHSVNVLTISGDDFGERWHTASSEPYLYDQSYTLVKHDFPTPTDSNGRCIIAEDIGERQKTNRPRKWRCTSECKAITSQEKESITDLKALFQQHVHKLRHGLNDVDGGYDVHGHYTVALDTLSVDTKKLYHDAVGHPLPCTNSGCRSRLRILRGTAPHFPVLRRLLCLLYEAIRHHKMLHSTGTALCVGDFETLCCLCCISDYKELFSEA